VLEELRVENLLLVDRAELRLAPGLNVITGETGAGKTMLAHALDLLLGGRPKRGIVRTGASEAYVEGLFTGPIANESPLADRVPNDAEELVIGRRVWADGRTRAYLCGRSISLSDLRELAPSLLSFYGQHEHRKLMLSAVQMDLLDSHCGSGVLALRDRIGAAHTQVGRLVQERESLLGLAAGRERELDLLSYELGEIDAAGPSEDEWDELTGERDRLRHLETLQLAAAAAVQALAGEQGGVGEVLARAVPGLESAAAIDPTLDPLVSRLASMRYEADDVAAELRRYESDIEAVPGRLEEVEERLALLSRLMRKYGGSVRAVLDHAEQCRRRHQELEQAEVRMEGVESELAKAQGELSKLAGSLTGARRNAAPKLAREVQVRLAELAMPDAQFEVEVTPRPDGCGPRGADTVELLIATTPGIPAGRLRDIASGGELSRVMLALLSVAHEGGSAGRDDPAPDGFRADTPLLVFDEIDSGVGGHTAHAVGQHLRQLASGRQVLCITHLPQVAALADRHFTIAKDTASRPVRAAVERLEGDQIVGEVVRMLGASEGDQAAGRHARQLLSQAA
jgi:DNA repair protein RecN (Recombination protein N)